MLGIIKISLIFFITLSCTTPEPKAETKSKSKPVVHEANVSKDRVSSFLEVDKDNPKAIEIMQETCNGQYQIIEDDANVQGHNKQVEIGLTKPIGKDKKTKPFIRYTCVRSR